MFTNVAFYVFCSILVVLLLSYFILAFKANVQAEQVNELDVRIATGQGQEKVLENKLLDYKTKISDYSTVISNHKIISEAFDFIEKRTLSNVWFSTFDVSESAIQLTGETTDLESLSQQVAVLEKSKDYVTGITVLDTQVQSPTKVRFIMSLSLNQRNFLYLTSP